MLCRFFAAKKRLTAAEWRIIISTVEQMLNYKTIRRDIK